ncbi:rubrerythrin [Clostridium fallax]|uniref:Rubrerythrin n=1 Tax=Clostridium fallax TaxID=1533 RepID=A0A1M4W2L4_9CLOT|nr:rubrerythrin family protein [Clostridium fallax]SHE75511.1 Rubrerythrin [Clostridium fallax]SQB22849.1 rubrerythrin [Clostridium fallax]
MKSLKGTKTADNLAKAFAGESQARNRYTFYASVARKEGYKQIEAVFLETADNERAHAKVFYDLLIKGLGAVHINVNADYPIGLGTTEENLLYAAEGEKEEWGDAYPAFQKIAKEEGFPEVENAFKHILEVEKGHEQRYRDLLTSLKDNTLFKRDTNQYWKCRNCGFIYDGLEAPTVCPACKHPQGYFEIMYNTRA